MQVLRDALEVNAGLDSLQDRYYAGYIAAFNDLIHMELVDQEAENID